MNNKRTGLLALLGAAAGAFAFYKYKTMSDQEKQDLKDKVSDTGRKLKEKVGEVENTLSSKYDELKKKGKEEYNDITS